MKTDEKKLTRKEKEGLVRKLYEEGYTYREIARKLRISVRDISRILRVEERRDEIDEIKERMEKIENRLKKNEDRLEWIVYRILWAFEAIGAEFPCNNCWNMTTLEFDEERATWFCKNCGTDLIR